MTPAGRAAVAAGVAASALAWSGASRADNVHADMRAYYGGERLSAYVVGGMGAAAAAAGGYLVTRSQDFDRGLGWPWLVMGSLETVGAVVYALQVGAEIDHYEALFARDPRAYRADEIDHMHGTSSRFVFYRAVELALTVGGAAVAGYGLATNRDVWKGAGLGVASLSLPFFVIDTVNDARASRYLDEIRRYQPAVGVQPLAPERGWVLSLSGRF